GEQTLVGARAVPLLGGVRVCSKINSDFAGGCLAVWLGASDEPTRQRSVRSEQQRHTAKQPQPSGAGRRLAICFVARRSQPTGGHAPGARAEAPRVLASGQAALPPKSEVIFEQTLRQVFSTGFISVRSFRAPIISGAISQRRGSSGEPAHAAGFVAPYIA